ncbi:MAG: ACP S-malonyltransferase [Candidatus Babeliales bacterium]
MKIAMLFPGYGSQFVGMGKELYDEYRIVQEYFEEASNCLNINFVKLCFASSDAELGKMNHAYPALFLVSSAIYALLEQEGIKPTVVSGYNDGEYAALYAGGCFSFPDGLYLLNKYALFFQESLEHISVEVIRVKGIATKELEKACLQASTFDGKVFIAIYNELTDHIVAGERSGIEHLRNLIGALKKVSMDELGVGIGLHSSLMNSVVEQFKIYLEKVDFKDLTIPMVNGLDGEQISQGKKIKDQLLRHINSPLHFTHVIDALLYYDLIVTVGPTIGLSKMIKKAYPKKQVISIHTSADIAELKKIVPNR